MSVSTAQNGQTCRKGEHLHYHVICALARHPCNRATPHFLNIFLPASEWLTPALALHEHVPLCKTLSTLGFWQSREAGCPHFSSIPEYHEWKPVTITIPMGRREGHIQKQREELEQLRIQEDVFHPQVLVYEHPGVVTVTSSMPW